MRICSSVSDSLDDLGQVTSKDFTMTVSFWAIQMLKGTFFESDDAADLLKITFSNAACTKNELLFNCIKVDAEKRDIYISMAPVTKT